MRRKISSGVIAALSALLSWAIPKYLEINNMITQENSYWLLCSIYIGVLVIICVLIWGFWPAIKRIRLKQGASKMAVIIGSILFVGGIVGIGLLLSQVHFHSERTRSEIQIQTDSLISDITAYAKTVPPMPMPRYSGDPIKDHEIFSEYTQQISDYYTQLNSDFFSKFNTRIADTMIKLHDLHIMNDSEFAQDQYLYNFMPTAYNTYASALLGKLNTYKVALDKLEQTLRTK